jgi:hypothetical protein
MAVYQRIPRPLTLSCPDTYPEIEMNDKLSEMPDISRGASEDVGEGRSSTRAVSGRLSESGGTTRNEKAGASKGVEKADESGRAESPSRESTLSENGRLGVRLLRVVVLAVCYFLLEIIVKALTVLQFIFVAWKKHPHEGMQRLGESIAKYIAAMLLYCTFASDDAPWPFMPWPSSASESQG